MKSPFPNSTEETVASALLLLSSSSPSNGRITGKKCNIDRSDQSLSLSKSFSRSSASSTVSSDGVSSDEARRTGLRMVASAISYSDREINLKVVRKSRSRTLWISDCRKISQKMTVFASASSSTEASSCLSGGSSSLVSSSESFKPKPKKEKPSARDVKKPTSSAVVVNSTHLLRRSEAILKVLAHNGSVSEVRIRQLLGDSPDTSKALRMLLKREEVRRSGAGGRSDPFIYQIAAR